MRRHVLQVLLAVLVVLLGISLRRLFEGPSPSVEGIANPVSIGFAAVPQPQDPTPNQGLTEAAPASLHGPLAIGTTPPPVPPPGLRIGTTPPPVPPPGLLAIGTTPPPVPPPGLRIGTTPPPVPPPGLFAIGTTPPPVPPPGLRIGTTPPPVPPPGLLAFLRDVPVEETPA